MVLHPNCAGIVAVDLIQPNCTGIMTADLLQQNSIGVEIYGILTYFNNLKNNYFQLDDLSECTV